MEGEGQGREQERQAETGSWENTAAEQRCGSGQEAVTRPSRFQCCQRNKSSVPRAGASEAVHARGLGRGFQGGFLLAKGGVVRAFRGIIVHKGIWAGFPADVDLGGRGCRSHG